ncbi:MAG: hypothetical protein ChlgKO_08280 [Chlamydiales bacterium]
MLTFIRYRLGELHREWQVRKRYYKNLTFAKHDRAIKKAYRFRNSFAIARKFHGTACYGETPLPILERLVKNCGLTKEDHIFELGAGRCRGAFFLNSLLDCKVTAAEIVPTFVKIARANAPQSVFIQEEDLLTCDLKNATCIYLYGTSLSGEMIRKLCKKLRGHSAKIITVSYALKEYDAHFVTEKSWEEKFPWGKTKIYLQTVS